MKKTIKYIIVFFLVSVFSACQDLLIETPEDRFVLDNFYSSETDAQAAIDAVYNRIGAGYYERIFFLVADLPADDYKNGGGMSNSFLQDIEYYRHTSENEFIKRVWRESYDG
ncbi:MAG: RagB/SusD family nutrient uptake outer membrane protein, partial [Cyclobacteriaceae bacterium]|nr:RagB/SusD family nutrient uptake outer membrane protein [Cyclobacteriaceae bacterium]